MILLIRIGNYINLFLKDVKRFMRRWALNLLKPEKWLITSIFFLHRMIILQVASSWEMTLKHQQYIIIYKCGMQITCLLLAPQHLRTMAATIQQEQLAPLHIAQTKGY